MINELREILTREGITTAAIIDDVYDDTPSSVDIDGESWNFFEDDLLEPEINLLRDYGVANPETRLEELKQDDTFIKFLWDRRGQSDVVKALFASYDKRQTAGKEQLEPLNNLLFKELALQGRTYDSQQLGKAAEAQLIFVDLFLGARQDKEARDKAMDRVKEIVAPRRESPPMIILMSSSTRLESMRDEFRDEAELVGSQFRTMRKTLLEESAELQELLYRITSSYRKTLQLTGFLELWNKALEDAKARFLKTVRLLDLRDYSDLHTLILNAEGELIGAYLLEVFGQYFQFELEEDTRLSTAALQLNEMQWDDYPAPHFLPSRASATIADGMLFRSSKILGHLDLEFGEVLFSTRVDALGEGVEPIADFAKGERIALLVLTPACDLQHDYAKRFLFITGVARPSELLLHKKPKELVTPILFHDGKDYVIEWDLGNPLTWTRSELANHIKSDFQRVRRFRSTFSIQLQQLFTSSLSRVGTPVMPPMQHWAGATISYKDREGKLRQLISVKPSDQNAVVLIGRSESALIDRLILAPDVVGGLRVAMIKVDSDALPEKLRASWRTSVEQRELFSKMEEGIPYSRDRLERSFKNTEYDIVTVVGPYIDPTKNPIDKDRMIKGDYGPLVIELEVPALGTVDDAR